MFDFFFLTEPQRDLFLISGSNESTATRIVTQFKKMLTVVKSNTKPDFPGKAEVTFFRIWKPVC